jgi:hypothetical protein
MMSDEPCKTPIEELLRTVPEDFRVGFEDDHTYRMLPMGHIAREAADEIDRLKELLTAKDDAELNAYAEGKKHTECRLSAEMGRYREALRKIAEEHDADGSMRFEAQAALSAGKERDA